MAGDNMAPGGGAPGVAADKAAGKAQELIDGFGRRLHYLRISLTDRCNLRCTYCMPSGGVPKLRHDDILTLEEMARVARVAVSLGVDKIRLTGGEPLLRRDLEVLLGELDALRPRPDLRITTNGLLLSRKLEALKRCGISTLNISLDTLKPERYGEITGLGQDEGRRAFQRVWEAINLALEAGCFTVKLNVVVMAGLNHDEVLDFARLTLKLPLAVRFIEYMPVGRHTPFLPQRFIDSQEILRELSRLGSCQELPVRPGDGPARRYRLPDSPGELGVISALSSHFCSACNRLRLTADGRLVPCLFSDQTVDLRGVLRSGAGDDEVAEALRQAAAIKPQRHLMHADIAQSAGCPMSRLGG